nr:hypothetical protein [Mycobacterium eburneum]
MSGVEITERGKAVIESGLSVRQAHEIRTGCSPHAPCADCVRAINQEGN